MTNKPDGGPAFPGETEEEVMHRAYPTAMPTYTYEKKYHSGMSLRTWLAGMALQVYQRNTGYSCEVIAKEVCEMADAVIKELEK